MAVTLRHALAQALAVCGMMAVCPAFIASTPSSAPDETLACVELRSWAEGYRDATLTLDDVVKLDGARQRAVFGVMAPSARAAVWREHLRRLEGQSRWTSAQRGVLREAQSLATAGLYEQRPEALRKLASFKVRVETLFTTPADKRVWSDLGSVLTVAVTLAPQCNCNLAEQECYQSACASVACNLYAPGCGFFLMSVCNGRCT